MEAVTIGHTHIGDDEINSVVLKVAKSIVTRGGGLYGVAL